MGDPPRPPFRGGADSGGSLRGTPPPASGVTKRPLLLALAQRLSVPALTADRAWSSLSLGVPVTVIL